MTNKAIDILTEEHRLILRAMIIAEKMAAAFEKDASVREDDARALLDFIANFADNFHHKKEEDILFKWMGERGFPVEGGPIAVMLAEHDIGRGFATDAKDALQSPPSPESLACLIQNLRHFAAHLRQHIFKEDNILYPMAERLCDADGEAELLNLYEGKIPMSRAIETNRRYKNIINELENVYV